MAILYEWMLVRIGGKDQKNTVKRGKCVAFGLAVETWQQFHTQSAQAQGNATAQRAYSFCGASPPDIEREARQMRSIWSGGGIASLC